MALSMSFFLVTCELPPPPIACYVDCKDAYDYVASTFPPSQAGYTLLSQLKLRQLYSLNLFHLALVPTTMMFSDIFTKKLVGQLRHGALDHWEALLHGRCPLLPAPPVGAGTGQPSQIVRPMPHFLSRLLSVLARPAGSLNS